MPPIETVRPSDGQPLRTVADVMRDIHERPEMHRHFTSDDVIACCTVYCSASRSSRGRAFNGLVVNTRLLEAHEGIWGGRCDVLIGQCACGYVHVPGAQA